VINQSYLLGLYGLPSTGGGWTSAPGAAASRKQPTAPWSASAKAPEPSELVRSALGGRRILNEAAAEVDLKGASPDYRKLFALHQALTTLSALADRSMQRQVPASEQALLQKRFSSGLKEVSDFLASAEFEKVRLVQGVTSSSLKTTAATPKGSATYVTQPVHQGALTEEVAAFQGEVRFDIAVETLTGSKVVEIDLAEMGGATRTLDAVIAHINGRLEDEGVQTRFGRTAVKAEPRTIQAGGKTITLPDRAEQWALTVKGNSVETVSFSAPQASDAVYVVQAAGSSGKPEVLKFQDDGGSAPPVQSRPGDTWWVEGRAGQSSLPDGVETVRASAAAADGGLWIVADLTDGLEHQPIKGQRDVALMKIDSAGQVVSTQVLGAASTATGFAIAVNSDGRVAVAGSVTNALDDGKAGSSPGLADSFVSVFDAQGEEIWTQRRGARAADEATAVMFGADGVVHVAGRSQSAMPGAVAVGGWDGYLQSFSQRQAHPLAPVTAVATAVSQFGSAGDDSVEAIAIDGQSLYTAGIESGRIIIRRFEVDAAGRPTLSSQRDLGAASGEISGLAVSEGKVIVSGATSNPSLAIGGVTHLHQGGRDAFVAVIDGSLDASEQDRLTYLGGSGNDSVADVKVLDGKVWLTGVADRPIGAKPEDPTRAYLARLNPLTGEVEWRREWQAADQQATPLALATVASGASVLDRLGLPQGTLQQSAPATLTSATSLRAGDRFYVSRSDGGRPVAVNIAANDTLESLARKIELASGRTLKVSLKTEKAEASGGAGVLLDVQRLSIEARDERKGAILTSGEVGRDALAGLGLAPGYIGGKGDDSLKTYGLNLSSSLDLKDPKVAKDKLENAMTAIRSAYRALAPATPGSKAVGPAPAYLTAQLANYQAALARLTGG
jgi:hypothetical protein